MAEGGQRGLTGTDESCQYLRELTRAGMSKLVVQGTARAATHAPADAPKGEELT